MWPPGSGNHAGLPLQILSYSYPVTTDVRGFPLPHRELDPPPDRPDPPAYFRFASYLLLREASPPPDLPRLFLEKKSRDRASDGPAVGLKPSTSTTGMVRFRRRWIPVRSEEHSLNSSHQKSSYAVFC